MNTLNIREATIDDAVHIALLGRVTFTETFGHYFKDPNDLMEYYERTFSVQKIRSSLLKPNNVFWIAFVNELPVGYAKLKLHSPSEFVYYKKVAQLQKIYVLKDFLSMKIGFQLQQKLIEKAIQSGKQGIWLSVLDENIRAINFYKKNKFSPVGQHDFDIGKEHFEFIVMAKKL